MANILNANLGSALQPLQSIGPAIQTAAAQAAAKAADEKAKLQQQQDQQFKLAGQNGTIGSSPYQPSQNLISQQQAEARAAEKAKADARMQQMQQQQQQRLLLSQQREKDRQAALARAQAQAQQRAQQQAAAQAHAQAAAKAKADAAMAARKDAMAAVEERKMTARPITGVAGPEMPTFGTPSISPAEKAKQAAELAAKIKANTPQPVQPTPSGYGNFNEYGFDRPLVDYLNNQQKLSTMDAGISYSYDPATQTFTGGARGGPIKKTLQEMQAEQAQSKTPAAFAQPYKKGGQVKSAQDTKKKYTSGGKINLNECRVSTAQKGKKNSNW